MLAGSATRDIVLPMSQILRHGLNQDQELGGIFPVYSVVKKSLTFVESNQTLALQTLTLRTNLA